MKVIFYDIKQLVYLCVHFTDYIRPQDYLEPNAPKSINLCIDDFNAVKINNLIFK